MSDNSTLEVQKIKKGDLIATPSGFAKILCVIKTQKNNGLASLCTLPSGLKITHHHPIFHNGEWVYPSSLVKPRQVACEYIYNLVVDKEHIVIINDTQLITLGHNYKQGVLEDPYLGSKKVVDDLK